MRRPKQPLRKLPTVVEPDHYLKSWPQFYWAISEGRKTFDIRRDDRAYQKGDVIEFAEFDIEGDGFTGETLMRRVAFVQAGGDFGLAVGYVVLGLEEIGADA